MNPFKMWKEFRHWQVERLEGQDQRQIQAPAYAGVLERPKKEFIYELTQVHTVKLRVRVRNKEELRFWNDAVRISLETPEGELIPGNDPDIVDIECYREKPTDLLRLDGPDENYAPRDTSHPPAVHVEPVEESMAEGYVNEPVAAIIGAIAHINGQDYIYCKAHMGKINQLDMGEDGFSWYITQDQTSDGTYTCRFCKKNFY